MALSAAKTYFITFYSQSKHRPLLSSAFELLEVTFKVTSFEKLHSNAVFQMTAQGMYRHADAKALNRLIAKAME
jgi:hypothetical protein